MVVGTILAIGLQVCSSAHIDDVDVTGLSANETASAQTTTFSCSSICVKCHDGTILLVTRDMTWSSFAAAVAWKVFEKFVKPNLPRPVSWMISAINWYTGPTTVFDLKPVCQQLKVIRRNFEAEVPGGDTIKIVYAASGNLFMQHLPDSSEIQRNPNTDKLTYDHLRKDMNQVTTMERNAPRNERVAQRRGEQLNDLIYNGAGSAIPGLVIGAAGNMLDNFIESTAGYMNDGFGQRVPILFQTVLHHNGAFCGDHGGLQNPGGSVADGYLFAGAAKVQLSQNGLLQQVQGLAQDFLSCPGKLR